MKQKNKANLKERALKLISYFKDKGFGKIFIKYFILLFVCLVLPVAIINIWFGQASRKEIKDEFIEINEIELESAYKSINAVVQAMKGNAYDLSQHSSVQYLSFLDSPKRDKLGYAELLYDLLETTYKLNDYIENICVYFKKSDEVFWCKGMAELEEYEEGEWLKTYGDSSSKITFQARKKNGRYPYLLTVTYPINAREEGNDGLIAIDINVESLAKYLGRGRYESKNNESVLLVLDATSEALIYSDEYQLYAREEEIIEAIATVGDKVFDSSLWTSARVI